MAKRLLNRASLGVAAASAGSPTGSCFYPLTKDAQPASGDPTPVDLAPVLVPACSLCQMTSSAGGLPSGMSGDGFRSQSAFSAMLDSAVAGTEGAVSPQEARTNTMMGSAALMMVHGVDDTWGLRGMMCALVDSIMTTMQGDATDASECESLAGRCVSRQAATYVMLLQAQPADG